MFGSYVVTRQGRVFYTSDTERWNQRYREERERDAAACYQWERYPEPAAVPRPQEDVRALRARVRELEDRIDVLDRQPVDLKKIGRSRLLDIGEELGLDFDYLDRKSMIKELEGVEAAAIRRAAREVGVEM